MKNHLFEDSKGIIHKANCVNCMTPQDLQKIKRRASCFDELLEVAYILQGKYQLERDKRGYNRVTAVISKAEETL